MNKLLLAILALGVVVLFTSADVQAQVSHPAGEITSGTMIGNLGIDGNFYVDADGGTAADGSTNAAYITRLGGQDEGLKVYATDRHLYTRYIEDSPEGSPGTWHFINEHDGGQSYEFMTVQSDGDVIFNAGNVGIGTTGPGEKLEVSGKIKATVDVCGPTRCLETLVVGTGDITAVSIGSNACSSGDCDLTTLDGSGSGLDADTLDTRDSSYFALASLTSVNIADTRASGDVTPDGFVDRDVKFSFTDDIAGSANAWDSVITMKGWTDSYRVWQLISGSSTAVGDDNLHFRTGVSSSWGTLRTVWDSGNDGSGSGLDADRVDGLEVHTGRNNVANRIVRTDGSGYIQAGWINTPSGAASAAWDKVYASQDNYIRYITKDTLCTAVTGHACGSDTDTNAATECGISMFLQGDGTCLSASQIVTAGGGGGSSVWVGTSSPTGINYANGNVGIGDSTPEEDLTVNGNVKATAFLYSSDYDLKENIETLDNSLEKILKLRGVSFNWKEDGQPSIGLVAQEVENVFPELVTGENGSKTVQYGNLVASLIEAVKEQQKEIVQLEARIKILENVK